MTGAPLELPMRERTLTAGPSLAVSMKLFVYGSLLSGEAHGARLGGSRLLGEARTEARYTLVDLGPYPALLEGGSTSVWGELYEVDGDVLAALDDFEGHPDEYRRVPVRLLSGDSVDSYVLPRTQALHGRIIPGGSWKTRPQPSLAAARRRR